MSGTSADREAYRHEHPEFQRQMERQREGIGWHAFVVNERLDGVGSNDCPDRR